ncbi:MAG: inositol monophosphatase [Planctomycetes bacterium]|nr:inositol monophosphatase [Planctomycetota bacterium]
MNGLSATERATALEVALKAAREAGVLLMEHLGHLSANQIASKDVARDLVTAADVGSERLIVSRLRAAFPTHEIEAEEEVRDSERGAPRWLLDPLDGTINFVHQLPAFAVSLGLYSGATPEVAVVHAPRLGETFWATRGGGAFLDGKRMAVSSAKTLGESILATGFPYKRNELKAQGRADNLENFGRVYYEVRGLRRMGSAALDLAYVAAGRFDGYWELYLSPHDVAAGALLVLEAGGVVTDFAGGGDWLRGQNVVAGGRAVVELLRERVRR